MSTNRSYQEGTAVSNQQSNTNSTFSVSANHGDSVTVSQQRSLNKDSYTKHINSQESQSRTVQMARYVSCSVLWGRAWKGSYLSECKSREQLLFQQDQVKHNYRWYLAGSVSKTSSSCNQTCPINPMHLTLTSSSSFAAGPWNVDSLGAFVALDPPAS